METLWFCIVSGMLTIYVILDGFDIGAGILHLFIARTDDERRTVLNAIGPVWDGNEVWLLAAGGTLYFAFPLLYASSFSGFYLPLMIVLWLLILRGLGIEFRHHISTQVWKSFWDTVFAAASILLAIFFGAALGNVIRGVPLEQSGYFFEPLWTTFTVVPEAGVLDWFTVVMGLVGLTTLVTHGALYLAVKTSGVLQLRARRAALAGWTGMLLTSVAAVTALAAIKPGMWSNYSGITAGYILPAIGAAGLAGSLVFLLQKKDLAAFLSSTAFILGTLGATAFAMYPVVLPASTNPEWSLTIYNTAARSYGLGIGLTWWIVGAVLTAAYFIYVYRLFRGKTNVTNEGY